MKHAIVPGRFQPFHQGHLHVIREALKEADRVTVVVRDMSPDKNNPLPASESVQLIERCLIIAGVYKDVVVVAVYDKEDGWDAAVLDRVGGYQGVFSGNPDILARFDENLRREVPRAVEGVSASKIRGGDPSGLIPGTEDIIAMTMGRYL